MNVLTRLEFREAKSAHIRSGNADDMAKILRSIGWSYERASEAALRFYMEAKPSQK